ILKNSLSPKLSPTPSSETVVQSQALVYLPISFFSSSPNLSLSSHLKLEEPLFDYRVFCIDFVFELHFTSIYEQSPQITTKMHNSNSNSNKCIKKKWRGSIKCTAWSTSFRSHPRPK
ncbi:hypothetical protein GIB67_037834, partial [Kingdonia uniflora]